jgi:hypothetical protein
MCNTQEDTLVDVLVFLDGEMFGRESWETSFSSTAIIFDFGSNLGCPDLDVDAEAEVDVGGFGTSTAIKPMLPVFSFFSMNLISFAYSFFFVLLTDLEIRLAGIGDGG